MVDLARQAIITSARADDLCLPFARSCSRSLDQSPVRPKSYNVSDNLDR